LLNERLSRRAFASSARRSVGSKKTVSWFGVYPDSLKSREKFLAFRGSGDSDGA
jgi:hypothetical protein